MCIAILKWNVKDTNTAYSKFSMESKESRKTKIALEADKNQISIPLIAKYVTHLKHFIELPDFTKCLLEPDEDYFALYKSLSDEYRKRQAVCRDVKPQALILRFKMKSPINFGKCFGKK